jgi:hypothetical protein
MDGAKAITSTDTYIRPVQAYLQNTRGLYLGAANITTGSAAAFAWRFRRHRLMAERLRSHQPCRIAASGMAMLIKRGIQCRPLLSVKLKYVW